ncbi:MAG: hypothetical protein PHF82_05330, partial [Lutispora sp.]|nr:hypothetical protein [Lutispora sp.]
MNKKNKSFIMLPVLILLLIIIVMFESVNEIPIRKKSIVNLTSSTYNTEKKLVIGRANDAVSLDPVLQPDDPSAYHLSADARRLQLPTRLCAGLETRLRKRRTHSVP